MKIYKESNDLKILIMNSIWINKRWEIIRRLAKNIFNIYILDFTQILRIVNIYQIYHIIIFFWNSFEFLPKIKYLKFENFILIENIIKSKEKLKLKLKYMSNMKLYIRYYI